MKLLENGQKILKAYLIERGYLGTKNPLVLYKELGTYNLFIDLANESKGFNYFGSDRDKNHISHETLTNTAEVKELKAFVNFIKWYSFITEIYPQNKAKFESRPQENEGYFFAGDID